MIATARKHEPEEPVGDSPAADSGGNWWSVPAEFGWTIRRAVRPLVAGAGVETVWVESWIVYDPRGQRCGEKSDRVLAEALGVLEFCRRRGLRLPEYLRSHGFWPRPITDRASAAVGNATPGEPQR